MIYDESDLIKLIKKHKVEEVVFSYSDIPMEGVMAKGALVNANGAAFSMVGAEPTMVKSKKPVVAVCAARTGCGKSQTTRRVCEVLQEMGKKVVAIRHPMPYGDLAKQACQRFAKYSDLDKHKCTIEEREEYEPHIAAGCVVYAGVDYEAILRQAEQEADVVIWDGGNNDTSFYTPDLLVTVVDPHRPDHSARYHPGEVNVRTADVLVINKIATADLENIELARSIARELNPDAAIVEAASPLFVEDWCQIQGKRVLVIEDGPTLTHGEMAYGAGWVAARKYGAAEIIDPRPYAVGSIKATFEKYPTTGNVLPAMGYGEEQTKELAETIAKTPAELVLIGTPIDLRRLIEIKQPALRVRYELQEIGVPTLEDILKEKLG